MLNDIYGDEKYQKIAKRNLENVIKYLLDENIEFSVVANMKFVNFEPKLPQAIFSKLGNFALFALVGYTFETTKVNQDFLTFEASFGKENFVSFLKISLDSILQVVVDEEILFLNPIAASSTFVAQKPSIEKSKNIFKENPNNKKLF
jgi:hypothetical protein